MRHRRIPGDGPLFNDLLYRIKTTDEILDPLRVFVSDKEFVKLYIGATVGEEYNVPTIAVLRSREEIDTFDFPPDCCIKPTHASGKIIVRRNDQPIDRNEIKNWFSIDYYKRGREANYRNLRPKVIVESLVFPETGAVDYRFFCYGGKAKLVVFDLDWPGQRERVLFDRKWNRQDYSLRFQSAAQTPPKPANYTEMLTIAEELAAPFGLVRIDLYSDGVRCLAGEITNCHANASARFIPSSADRTAGELMLA